MFYFVIYDILLYHTTDLCLTIAANGLTDNTLFAHRCTQMTTDSF